MVYHNAASSYALKLQMSDDNTAASSLYGVYVSDRRVECATRKCDERRLGSYEHPIYLLC